MTIAPLFDVVWTGLMTLFIVATTHTISIHADAVAVIGRWLLRSSALIGVPTVWLVLQPVPPPTSAIVFMILYCAWTTTTAIALTNWLAHIWRRRSAAEQAAASIVAKLDQLESPTATPREEVTP